MTKKFQTDVIKAISFVPGLVGLSKIEPGSSNSTLPEKDWIKGISFEETEQGLYIRVGAIIDVDIRAKIVSKELTSSIKQIVKGTKYKIASIVVYIRGVK